MEVQADAVVLSYRCKNSHGEWCEVNQRIGLTRTACHYGGSRPWINCPRCHGRVAILYLWNVPLCRKCARLVYPSQSEDVTGRSWRRSRKIAKHLGQEAEVSAWMVPRRPKGMRQATFERLEKDWWREEQLRDCILAGFLGRFAGFL